MRAILEFNRTSIPRAFAWLSAFMEQIKDSDKEYVIECREYRKKRSLNANAYHWKLVSEIADRRTLGSDVVSKEQVHFELLRDYGQRELVSVRSDIDISGYIKYYEERGRGTVNGVEFTHYMVYKSSAEMDSKEMSVLIEGTVQEAKQLGIETRPPAEIRSMCERWDNEKYHAVA